MNNAVSCTEAYLSRYAATPVGLYRSRIGGVLFFALILAMVGIGARQTTAASESSGARLHLRAIDGGVGVVLYLAWALDFVLGTFCILCAADPTCR